jgi:Tol biopolymer transport system component
MTDLDTLARAATHELLERTTPDVRSRLSDLRRTRTRRTTAKLTTVGAVAALAIGGWQLAGSREQTIEPAPQPEIARNGTLLALRAEAVGTQEQWRPLVGERLDNLPYDVALFAQYQFTADGTEIVYADRRARISSVDLATGRTRTLADCPDNVCAASVSPDVGTIAYSDGDGVWLVAVGSGERTGVPRSDVGAVGAPAWSPDGGSLAFVGADGVYVAGLESGSVRRVADALDPAGPVGWSPDGQTLAYLDGLPVQRRGHDETAFTVKLVDLDSGRITSLLDAGQCGCAGVAAPTLAWSPDGRTVAVAITRDAALPWGVYLVPVDGSEPERVASGSYASLAWQPLRG